MDKNSHFKIYMERPQKLVGVIVKPNGKPRNSLYFRVYREHSWLRLEHLVVPIVSVHRFKELESPTHLCLI